MSRKKKNGNKPSPDKVVILVTVTIQLINALIELIRKLIE